MVKDKQETEKNVEFAEGGDTPMFGPQSAETDVPGNTGKTPKAAPGAKYASGGSTKMFGFHGAEPQSPGRDECALMVFKKDITPIGKKGTVTKHKGKGSAEHKPDPMAQISNRYPKPAPAAVPAPAPMGPPQQMPLPLG